MTEDSPLTVAGAAAELGDFHIARTAFPFDPRRGEPSTSSLLGAVGAVNRVVDDRLQRGKSVGERSRSWLEDERRFDLVQRTAADRRYAVEARSVGDLLGTKLLAAPRSDDDVRLAVYYVLRRYDAVLGRFAGCAVGKNIDAARDLDQLRHPADAADDGIVPFLEIKLGPLSPMRSAFARFRQPTGQFLHQPAGAIGGADDRAQAADHVEDLGDRALVEGVHVDAVTNKRGRN